jgi:hypothetical protein
MKKFFLLTIIFAVISVSVQGTFAIFGTSSEGMISAANAASERCDYKSAADLRSLKSWIEIKMNRSYEVISVLNRDDIVEVLVCKK